MPSTKTSRLLLPNGKASLNHAQIHAAHRMWTRDTEFWHDELKLWQDEIKQLRRNLAKLKDALGDHEDGLRQHGACLQLNQQETNTHEHLIAEYERGESPAKLIELTKSHRNEEQRHSKLRLAHERIKMQQHTLLAQFHLLLKCLETCIIKNGKVKSNELSVASLRRKKGKVRTA